MPRRGVGVYDCEVYMVGSRVTYPELSALATDSEREKPSDI